MKDMNEIFKDACNEYAKATGFITRVSEIIQTKQPGFKTEIALSQFDVILQNILIACAIDDGRIFRIESSFIQKITDHADILDYLNNAVQKKHSVSLDLSWERLENLPKKQLDQLKDIMKQELFDVINDFVQPFAIVDAIDTANDHLSFFLDRILAIVGAMSTISGSLETKEEAARVAQVLADATKMFQTLFAKYEAAATTALNNGAGQKQNDTKSGSSSLKDFYNAKKN